MPSTSPGRGSRVVAVMARRIGYRAASRNPSTRVVFPTPLGPETTTSGASRAPAGVVMSLDVLDQFPDLFQRRLDLDHVPGDRNIPGLRPDRVRLPAHLLDDEFESSAGAVVVLPD